MKNARIFSFEPGPQKARRGRKKNTASVSLFQLLSKLAAWLRTHKINRAQHKLRLSETVSLGEKRFAAVLEYEDQRFLIAGAAQSVQLLTELRRAGGSKTVVRKKSLPMETLQP